MATTAGFAATGGLATTGGFGAGGGGAFAIGSFFSGTGAGLGAGGATAGGGSFFATTGGGAGFSGSTFRSVAGLVGGARPSGGLSARGSLAGGRAATCSFSSLANCSPASGAIALLGYFVFSVRKDWMASWVRPTLTYVFPSQ